MAAAIHWTFALHCQVPRLNNICRVIINKNGSFLTPLHTCRGSSSSSSCWIEGGSLTNLPYLARSQQFRYFDMQIKESAQEILKCILHLQRQIPVQRDSCGPLASRYVGTYNKGRMIWNNNHSRRLVCLANPFINHSKHGKIEGWLRLLKLPLQDEIRSHNIHNNNNTTK